MKFAALGLLVMALATPAKAQDCAFSGASREAVERALTAWDRLEQGRIRATDPVRPIIQIFDLQCQYTLVPSVEGPFRVGERAFDVRALAHGGMVAVGAADPFPVGKTAFATDEGMGGVPVFVIGLPEVWAADTADRRDPHQLFMGVFVHEFSHVQQMTGLARRFEALEAAGYSGFALGDDVMQKTFGNDPDYVAAYGREMEVFTAAATAPDRTTAAARLAEGHALMAARRQRWFSGPDRAGWAAADDVFLTMEGAGQWAAFTWMTDPQGGGLSPEAGLQAMRTRWWTQEEGMIIMLALDKVLPEWPALTFGAQGLTIDELIQRALAQ